MMALAHQNEKAKYMNRMKIILAVCAIIAASAHAQGFVNVNFESANNLTNSGMSMPVANALPGWTAYNSINVLVNITYLTNSAYVGGTLELLGGSAALSGNAFSVYLGTQGAISQTATVPADAASLEFEATSPGTGLSVTLGGQDLHYSLLYEGTVYGIYGVNIPAGLDAQMETLTFSMPSFGSTLLDDIEFSSSGVPEPSTCALIGLGALLFAFRPHRQ